MVNNAHADVDSPTRDRRIFAIKTTTPVFHYDVLYRNALVIIFIIIIIVTIIATVQK